MAMVLPSGDQATLMMASMLGTFTCSSLRDSMSTNERKLSPLENVTKAMRRLSGDQEPADSMKRSDSKSASRSDETSLRMICPVFASARYMSMEKSSRAERKAT